MMATDIEITQFVDGLDLTDSDLESFLQTALAYPQALFRKAVVALMDDLSLAATLNGMTAQEIETFLDARAETADTEAQDLLAALRAAEPGLDILLGRHFDTYARTANAPVEDFTHKANVKGSLGLDSPLPSFPRENAVHDAYVLAYGEDPGTKALKEALDEAKDGLDPIWDEADDVMDALETLADNPVFIDGFQSDLLLSESILGFILRGLWRSEAVPAGVVLGHVLDSIEAETNFGFDKNAAETSHRYGIDTVLDFSSGAVEDWRDAHPTDPEAWREFLAKVVVLPKFYRDVEDEAGFLGASELVTFDSYISANSNAYDKWDAFFEAARRLLLRNRELCRLVIERGPVNG